MEYRIVDLAAARAGRPELSLHAGCIRTRPEAEAELARLKCARPDLADLAIEAYIPGGPKADLAGMAGWLRAAGMSEEEIARAGALGVSLDELAGRPAPRKNSQKSV